VHNVPGAFVWSENAQCIFCSNSGESNVQHPMLKNWRLQIDTYALESLHMAKQSLMGELSRGELSTSANQR
jgi:hypothetical protein